MTNPEIEIPNGYQYTAIEGWESNYKSHVPFLATVTDVVYPTLLEVLEHDAKRLFGKNLQQSSVCLLCFYGCSN